MQKLRWPGRSWCCVVVVYAVWSFACGAAFAFSGTTESALSTDFFYNIDGAVVSVGEGHACAIEHRQGQQDYGGQITCWGVDQSNQVAAPDVLIDAHNAKY